MNRQEYLAYIGDNLESILQETRFNNYKKQLAARKLSADFQRSYTEEYLWTKAIYLSSNGCLLLDSGENVRLAIKSLKEAAEVFENLSAIGEDYDPGYSLILAALCYDLAGYQANALCLTKKLENYSLSSGDGIDLRYDNYIIGQLRLVLLKNIFHARATINNDFNSNIGVNLFNTSIGHWYEAVLNGTQNEFIDDFNRTYIYYLNEQNIYLSHLVFLLRSRTKIYNERSIWNNLFAIDAIRTNANWTKYIKLLTHDIYDRNVIKQSDKRVSKFEFWISQIRAIESGVLNAEQNFVIQMPTSAGKTFIAEIAIVNALLTYPDKKCVYIAPFRALTNEKESELADYISKLGFSVSALSGSYEMDEFQEMILEDTDVLIATPEKIDLLLRLNPDYFNSISLIVVDEGHIVGEISSRSSLLEFLIIRLRIKVSSLKTLFISAVMPPENANEYSVWLSATDRNVIRSKLFADSPVSEEWEPTKKLIGRFDWSGSNGRITYKNVNTDNEANAGVTNAFVPAIIRKRQYSGRFPNGDKKETSACLAFELAKDGNCLVFCSQVRYTDSVGESLLDLLGILDNDAVAIPQVFRPNREKESYFFANKWYGADSYITRCIERGIGVHFGDMPEAVRRSVESDYASGNLRILVCTNTVAQGLNFPIKYLVVHSTIISAGVGGVHKVTVRDFWNLVGRAGRAGKETEGQVIFVVNSPTDARSYNEYTEKSNIEGAYSMLFNVLNLLVTERATSEEFDADIRILAEPYLLSVLAEEAVETDDQAKVEAIINNSLFKVQADARQMDLAPLRNSFAGIMSSIREEVPQELINVYSETGFSLKSNQAISTYIDANVDQIMDNVESDNYEGLLESIFDLFSEGNIDEVTSEKLERIGEPASSFTEIAKKWITGAEVDQLLEDWFTINDQIGRFHILLSEGFYFRYPWGITAFITILKAKQAIDSENIPVNILNLSSYLKFGLNNPTACLARSIGIKNRDTSLLLAEQSNYLLGRDLIKWVANLTDEDVNGFDLNVYDRKNVLETSIKLTPIRFQETPTEFTFAVRGTTFDDGRKVSSLLVNAGDILQYAREPSNLFDPYAIKLFFLGNELGFVPREQSKITAVEIDINQTEYEITVAGVEEMNDYRKINITMVKVA